MNFNEKSFKKFVKAFMDKKFYSTPEMEVLIMKFEDGILLNTSDDINFHDEVGPDPDD